MSMTSRFRRIGPWAIAPCFLFGSLLADDGPGRPAPLPVKNAEASAEAGMKPYAELIEHTELEIDMVPIPGGVFRMGSPEDEADRGEDEGPRREITVSPFWMSKCEITWDQYDVWNEDIDQLRRKMMSLKMTPRDLAVDGVSRPTEPYTDMSFGMGREDFPAICMTQHAARTYCQWLSAKTGRYYRLPTEAEWEYACRAGTDTPYHFGDDVDELEDYGWFFDNSDDTYQRVGQKKPNPWGLHDMHGNVAEWVLDQYTPYEEVEETNNPLAVPKTLYPRVVRGAVGTAILIDCVVRPASLPKKIGNNKIHKFHVASGITRMLVPSGSASSGRWSNRPPKRRRRSGRRPPRNRKIPKNRTSSCPTRTSSLPIEPRYE